MTHTLPNSYSPHRHLFYLLQIEGAIECIRPEDLDAPQGKNLNDDRWGASQISQSNLNVSSQIWPRSFTHLNDDRWEASTIPQSNLTALIHTQRVAQSRCIVVGSVGQWCALPPRQQTLPWEYHVEMKSHCMQSGLGINDYQAIRSSADY